jgi:hypothetical protein
MRFALILVKLWDIITVKRPMVMAQSSFVMDMALAFENTATMFPCRGVRP